MKIAVIGLGYVGLPLALSFGRKFQGTVGFDISDERIRTLREGIDHTGETTTEEIHSADIVFTQNPEDMRGCDFFIVGVPTPVDHNNHPDLAALCDATSKVGKVISSGGIVVFESTVYPGVTEEICGKILEETSGLKVGKDIKLGYSPERINPGDKEHTFENVIKVVSGQDAETLETIASVYEQVVKPGVHRAPNIKTAEAAKVIENTQRDLNIALMNELSMIFDRMGIRTSDVLEAAGTKWNFLKFVPGLVGGHCIGVDPYYLTTAAQQLGYHPEVILAGRRINDAMGKYVAERTIKRMVQLGVPIREARVGIFGLTFKENVSDIRNSRVPDIVHELREFGCDPLVHDPVADGSEAEHEYGVKLSPLEELSGLDVLILAVAHTDFMDKSLSFFTDALNPQAVFVDVKSIIDEGQLPAGVSYWSL